MGDDREEHDRELQVLHGQANFSEQRPLGNNIMTGNKIMKSNSIASLLEDRRIYKVCRLNGTV